MRLTVEVTLGLRYSNHPPALNNFAYISSALSFPNQERRQYKILT